MSAAENTSSAPVSLHETSENTTCQIFSWTSEGDNVLVRVPFFCLFAEYLTNYSADLNKTFKKEMLGAPPRLINFLSRLEPRQSSDLGKLERGHDSASFKDLLKFKLVGS